MKVKKFLICFILALCVLISNNSAMVFAQTPVDAITEVTGKLGNSKNFEETIKATLVSEIETEDGHQFRIAIPVNNEASKTGSDTIAVQATSIYYIDVSISGSGGKVIGKVWHVMPMPTHNLEISLWAGDTWASNKVTFVRTTNVGAWPFSTNVEATPTSSKFWDVSITGTIDGQSFYYSTYDFLFNKVGVEYPDVYDYYTSSIFMTVPSSATWSKVSNPLAPLTSTQLAAYRTWYQNTYHSGDPLNWTNVQVHHIRPRAYGGTHDYSNLMPLHTTTHTPVTTWWANY